MIVGKASVRRDFPGSGHGYVALSILPEALLPYLVSKLAYKILGLICLCHHLKNPENEVAQGHAIN